MHRRAKGQREGLRKCVCVYMRKTAWVMQWVCVFLFCKLLNYLQSQTPDTASTVLITSLESIEQTILFSGLLFLVFIVSACISRFLLSEKWFPHFLTWVYKAYWIDKNVFSKTCHVQSWVVLLQVITNSHIKRTAYHICIQVHSLLIIRSLDAYSTNPKYMTKNSKCWLQTSFVRTWNAIKIIYNLLLT